MSKYEMFFAEADEIDRIERQGVGEGHESSDEEELADDADATETRKKNRQMDEVSSYRNFFIPLL